MSALKISSCGARIRTSCSCGPFSSSFSAGALENSLKLASPFPVTASLMLFSWPGVKKLDDMLDIVTSAHKLL